MVPLGFIQKSIANLSLFVFYQYAQINKKSADFRGPIWYQLYKYKFYNEPSQKNTDS